MAVLMFSLAVSPALSGLAFATPDSENENARDSDKTESRASTAESQEEQRDSDKESVKESTADPADRDSLDRDTKGNDCRPGQEPTEECPRQG